MFSYGFAGLHERLGVVMGEPVECEHAGPESGDSYQQTTTGIALYRGNMNMTMFTNGREHWALTDSGLVHWSGWHDNAGPLGVAAPTGADQEQMTTASIGVYPRVEAATVVQAWDDDDRRLVVQRAGTSYAIRTVDGCSDGQPLDGRTVFVVSPGAFAGPNSRLILRIGGRECMIADSHPI